MRRSNPLYGNANGLPGMAKSSYVAVGGRRRVQTTTPRSSYPQGNVGLRQGLSPRPSPVMIPSGPDPSLSRRIDALDLRINSTEQSNRTLLDEMMRLQQEIKANVRKNEMGIQEERDSRSRMELTVRQNLSKNQEVDDRIRKCEDAIKDNKGTVQQLSMHVQNIERMASSLQKEQNEKRGGSSSKIEEYRQQISRLSSDNDHLTKIMNNLREEARDNGSRIDNLQEEILTLQNNMRLQSRLMEENARKPQTKTPGVEKKILDNDRTNTEAKIMQLNSMIQELSGRLSSEASKREKNEQDLGIKLNNLTNNVTTSKSGNEKAQKEYDDKIKDMQMGFSDSDKKQIQMEMSRVTNELNAKIDTNDAKLRDDTINKLTVIESTLLEENKKRAIKEKEMEDKIVKGLKNMKDKGEEESTTLKTTLDKQVAENKEKLSSLNKRMNEVEKEVRGHKIEQERLLEAEITERLNSDKMLDAKIEDLEDDVQLGFKTLQEEVGQKPKKSSKKPVTPAVTSTVDMDEITRMQDENAKGLKKQVASQIGDLDKRIANIETNVKQQDAIIENRLLTSKEEEKEAATLMGDQMQQQIDTMVFKHSKLKKKVDDLEKDVSATPKNLLTFKEDTNTSLSEMQDAIRKERKDRKKDVEELKSNMEKIVGSENQSSVPSIAQVNASMEQTQTGLKKCAESVHVVKKMLGDKIKDEEKIREKQCSILETDVDRLETKIKDVKARIKSSGNPQDTITDFGF